MVDVTIAPNQDEFAEISIEADDVDPEIVKVS